jgi:hypothetical protein
MSTNPERLQKHLDRAARHDTPFKDNFGNVMQLPKLDKIVLNTGIGKQAVLDRKRTVEALFTMELITGQKASITRAKKSIDKFKLREKMPIGCKTTLRKQNAFRLLDCLIHTALPNIEGFAPTEIRKAKPGPQSGIVAGGRSSEGRRDGFFSLLEDHELKGNEKNYNVKTIQTRPVEKNANTRQISRTSSHS